MLSMLLDSTSDLQNLNMFKGSAWGCHLHTSFDPSLWLRKRSNACVFAANAQTTMLWYFFKRILTITLNINQIITSYLYSFVEQSMVYVSARQVRKSTYLCSRHECCLLG